jgi:hypothetical protein
VGYSESDDFIHWSAPETIWAPGAPEDRLARKRGFQWADFYGLCGFNYGDGYLGLLWRFFIDYELERGTHEGKIEVFLAGSPDGKNWRRLSDEALIPLSPNGWDSGMITTAGQPIFLRNSIRLYYGAQISVTVPAKEARTMTNRVSDSTSDLRLCARMASFTLRRPKVA